MLDLFNSSEFVVFSTRDFANHQGLSPSAASRRLARLAQKRLLKRVTRGVWANTGHPYFHPLSCVPVLLGDEQGYVSFLTALHLHGLLSQIPSTWQIATTGHSRKLKSAIGDFDFIQIKPELMEEGLIWSDARIPWLQASPEKALLDTLYISTRKGRRFSRLPELDLADGLFDWQEFDRLMAQLPFSERVRSAVRRAQDARCKTQDARRKTQDARRKTQDARRKTQDARS